MATAAAVFEEQASRYERSVQIRWGELEQWERDYYDEFVRFHSDSRAVGRFIAPVEYHSGASGVTLADSLNSSSPVQRTVTLAYALLVAGALLLPLYLLPLAAWLGFVNCTRRLWEHGVVQMAIAAALIVLHIYGQQWVRDSSPVLAPFFS